MNTVPGLRPFSGDVYKEWCVASDAALKLVPVSNLPIVPAKYGVHPAWPMRLEIFEGGGARWATKQTLAQFALGDTCDYPLAPKSVTGAWNALRYMHHHIADVTPSYKEGRVVLGRKHALTAEQYTVFKRLPLAFMPTDAPADPVQPTAHYELIVPTLYETLRMVEDRPDCADFFPRISHKSLLFLMDFVNQTLKPTQLITFPRGK